MNYFILKLKTKQIFIKKPFWIAPVDMDKEKDNNKEIRISLLQETYKIYVYFLPTVFRQDINFFQKKSDILYFKHSMFSKMKKEFKICWELFGIKYQAPQTWYNNFR